MKNYLLFVIISVVLVSGCTTQQQPDLQTGPIECVDSINCPAGWYCGQDNYCKEGGAQPVACPYECCQGNPVYIDRPCAPGLRCCFDDSCKQSC